MTLWKTYAPESVSPGKPAKPDFVGTGGLTSVTELFKYVFGLRRRGSRLIWDVKLTERHGVLGYPIGREGTIDLICQARVFSSEKPVIQSRVNSPVEIELIWNEGRGRDIIRLE